MSEEDLRGADLRRYVQGPKSEALQDGVRSLDADLADWVDNFVFDNVWARDGLSFEERFIVAVTSLASLQNHDQLRAYLFGAVHAGVPGQKIQEILLMLTVYGGFPPAIQALTVWREVASACKASGIQVGI